MREYLRSFRWVDYFFFVLTEPRKLVMLFSKEEVPSLVVGCVNLAFVAISEILALSLLGRETTYFYDKITYGWIMSLLILVMQVVIIASLIDSACQFLGFNGNVRRTINLLSFSLFPRVLILPAVFIFRILNFAPYFFYVLISLGLMIWSALIVIQGVSEIHSTNIGRSILAFLIPFVFVGLLVFFVVLLAVLKFVGYLAAL